MDNCYDSPIIKKRYTKSNTKLFNTKFHSIKLFKTNNQLSNSITDMQNVYKYSLKRKKHKLKLKREPVEISLDNLRNDLMLARSEVIKRNNEIINLKRKNDKLMTDNISNKTLLANILEIPIGKYITKRKLIHKINSCKLNKQKKESLKTSYEILKLKSELNNKKRLFSEKTNYFEILNKNTKLKYFNNLKDEYHNKCIKQNSLLKKLSNLGKKYSEQQNSVIEIKENLKMQNITSNNLIEIESKEVDIINQMIDKKVNLINQISILKDRIKKHQKSHVSKEKEITEKEKNNTFDEQKLFILKEYSKNRLKEKNSISALRKTKNDDESILKNYSEEISKLEKESNDLFLKLSKYKEEKPKLIFKAKEPKKNIEQMISLKKELDNLKKLKIETEQKHIKIQNELKEKNNEYNTNNELLKKKIEDNINLKNDLDKKIQELKETNEKLINKAKDINSKIIQSKEEYDKLCQNEIELKAQIEQNSLIEQENKQNLEKERQNNMNKLAKKRKRDIDNLKKEQNKLNLFKKSIEDENKYLMQELNEFNQGLIEYEKIEKELNDAQLKLNNLKKK